MKLKVWMGIALVCSMLVATTGAMLVAAMDPAEPLSVPNQLVLNDPADPIGVTRVG